MVTSPNSKPRDSRTRAGSHGTFDLTRSERGGGLDRVSSDLARSSKDHFGDTEPDDSLLSTRVRDTDSEKFRALTDRLHRSPGSSYVKDSTELNFDLDDSGDESDASTNLSSDFTETVDSNPHVIGSALTSPIPMGLSSPSVLHILPPPRPISMIQPVSALTQMIQASQAKEANPMEKFRVHSGKGELSHLSLKIYFHKSKEPKKPLQVILKRHNTAEGSGASKEVAVYEAIGFSLYRYIEEGRQPPLSETQLDINHWALRMVEDDGTPDEDFPRMD